LDYEGIEGAVGAVGLVETVAVVAPYLMRTAQPAGVVVRRLVAQPTLQAAGVLQPVGGLLATDCQQQAACVLAPTAVRRQPSRAHRLRDYSRRQLPLARSEHQQLPPEQPAGLSECLRLSRRDSGPTSGERS
jgi:hypothetical protein